MTPGRAASFFGLVHGILGRVRGGAGHNRHAPSRHFDRDIDDLQPFVVRKRGRLAGGAAGDQKIDARFHLPRDQVAQGSLVDGAVLLEWSDQCRTAATELHEIKITLIGVWEKQQMCQARTT